MTWIMLIYRLPCAKTSARKVALWRKLKKIGVYSAQDSVCLLPSSEKNLEMIEWLAAELHDAGGVASVWEVHALSESQEREMKEYFLEQVNSQYREIINEVRACSTKKGLKVLWARYNSVKAQDYLNSPLSVEARAVCEKKATELKQEKNR